MWHNSIQYTVPSQTAYSNQPVTSRFKGQLQGQGALWPLLSSVISHLGAVHWGPNLSGPLHEVAPVSEGSNEVHDPRGAEGQSASTSWQFFLLSRKGKNPPRASGMGHQQNGAPISAAECPQEVTRWISADLSARIIGWGTPFFALSLESMRKRATFYTSVPKRSQGSKGQESPLWGRKRSPQGQKV